MISGMNIAITFFLSYHMRFSQGGKDETEKAGVPAQTRACDVGGGRIAFVSLPPRYMPTCKAHP